MTNLASKDSHDEKSSVFSVTYHEIGETYTGLKENVTEKLSNYLLTYGAALAHHPSIKEEEKEEEPIDPLKQEIEKEVVPKNTRENIEIEVENIEPIIETKKEKKKKKKDKKEKKNKKKK